MGVELEWDGEGLDETGADRYTGDIVVRIDEKYFRPCEVDLLLGDATKTREKLGWKLNYDLNGLIDDMMTISIIII